GIATPGGARSGSPSWPGGSARRAGSAAGTVARVSWTSPARAASSGNLSRQPHAQTLRCRILCATYRILRRDQDQEDPMEELMQKMIDTVGIDRATAEKVIAFLK